MRHALDLRILSTSAALGCHGVEKCSIKHGAEASVGWPTEKIFPAELSPRSRARCFSLCGSLWYDDGLSGVVLLCFALEPGAGMGGGDGGGDGIDFPVEITI